MKWPTGWNGEIQMKPLSDDAGSEQRIYVCRSDELEDSGKGASFDVMLQGAKKARAFVVRYQGQVHGYINRCPHLGAELDWRRDFFFSRSGHKLICALHGATFSPVDGAYLAGPCETGLTSVRVVEQDGAVYWLPDELISFPAV
ncbi:hypothetical protein CUZ56_00079 [Saezia sanguinis]|uniref:Rieske domain-containing protein n=2 Tax=Saezia sanguinis TaxID=1965230 RepID=A0A433SG30_9BURK|nr:hypothetical protein CUZ56_00079 [Saezia sanguinis]